MSTRNATPTTGGAPAIPENLLEAIAQAAQWQLSNACEHLVSAGEPGFHVSLAQVERHIDYYWQLRREGQLNDVNALKELVAYALRDAGYEIKEVARGGGTPEAVIEQATRAKRLADFEATL